LGDPCRRDPITLPPRPNNIAAGTQCRLPPGPNVACRRDPIALPPGPNTPCVAAVKHCRRDPIPLPPGPNRQTQNCRRDPIVQRELPPGPNSQTQNYRRDPIVGCAQVSRCQPPGANRCQRRLVSADHPVAWPYALLLAALYWGPAAGVGQLSWGAPKAPGASLALRKRWARLRATRLSGRALQGRQAGSERSPELLQSLLTRSAGEAGPLRGTGLKPSREASLLR
jgi:hypothetical protein